MFTVTNLINFCAEPQQQTLRYSAELGCRGEADSKQLLVTIILYYNQIFTTSKDIYSEMMCTFLHSFYRKSDC